MLVLSRREIEALIDLDRLVDALAEAMADLSAGAASMPPRIAARVAGREGILAAMPAFVPSRGALVTKLVSLFPHNRDCPTHQAVILCFDPENGTPIALLDGTFFADGEVAGRAMSEIPHPFVVESLERFASLPASERAKIRFTHLNHTNPAAEPRSAASRRIRRAGMAVARDGEVHEL